MDSLGIETFGSELFPSNLGASNERPQERSLQPIRIGIIADFVEEKWPSMDLVAEMLAAHLPAALGVPEKSQVQLIRPPLKRRFGTLPLGARRAGGLAWSLDRLANRFFDYPRFLRLERGNYDLFHLADHSYSQLVHELPAGRTVVTCHDLDTFRCLWAPRNAGRGPLFLAMTRRILSGLQKAAHICCDSEATRDELLARRLVPSERASVIPLGIHPSFTVASESMPTGDDEPRPFSLATIDLLHVGSTIPRKRIDVLLEVFHRVRQFEPQARLLRVGGAFTPAQKAQVDQLGLAEAIDVLPHLTLAKLAAVYRRAALVLLPSDAEGFGFPVVEAMASGTPIVVSDLPVLREVGGEAAEYAAVGNAELWAKAIGQLLRLRQNEPVAWNERRERCRNQARKFTWEETARRTAQVYHDVLGRADNEITMLEELPRS